MFKSSRNSGTERNGGVDRMSGSGGYVSSDEAEVQEGEELDK